MAAISPGCGRDRATADELGLRLAPAGADRQVGRADAALGARDEEALDAPVLERVKGDRAEAPAGAQALPGERQRGVELAELVVDGDPQGLEDALGGMAAGEARRGGDGAGDDVDERDRRVDRRALALADDRAGDRPGVALLAEVAEDRLEMALLGLVDELVGGALEARIHPHVQRRVVGVGEAALPGVDLHRGHAEIHQHGVGLQALVAQLREALDERRADEARRAA